MIVSTLNTITNKEIIETVGLVCGSASNKINIKSKDIGIALSTVTKNLLKGDLDIPEEIDSFTEARERSIERMKEAAEKLGANAIVGARFANIYSDEFRFELTIYGTAVIIK